MKFWDDVTDADPKNAARQAALEQLNEARNGIAHQDFTKPIFDGRTTVLRSDVRRWRATCSALAVDFDAVMVQQLTALSGTAPW
jgi:hypothetical protein